MKTFNYRTMLSVSGAMILGISPEAAAQAKVSLQDAINGMLANGCLGNGSVGMFQEEDIVQQELSLAEQNIVRTGGFSAGQAVFLVTSIDGEELDENQLSIITDNYSGLISIVACNSESCDIDSLGVNADNESIVFDQNNPDMGLFGTYAVLNFGDDIHIDSFFDDVLGSGNRANSLTIEVTQQVEHAFNQKSGPSIGLPLDQGLRDLCSTTTRTTGLKSFTQQLTFSFNLTNESKGSVTTPASAIGGTVGLTSGQSIGSATRTQEGVARRQGGLSALIERLRRKFKKERAERYVQYAMLGDKLPYMPQEKSYTVVTDAAGGVINLDRNPTELDSSAYSADSAFASIGAAVVFHGTLDDEPDWILGGSLGYETVDSSKTSGANAFSRAESETENISFSGFLGWSSSPFSIDGEDNARAYVTASATYGQGDQTYKREFEATYQSGVELNADDEYEAVTTSVFDQMTGGIDQSYWSGSLQATVSGKFENLTVAPRASVTYVKFKSDGLTEEVSSSGVREGTGSYAGGALALDYAPVEDEWVETRIGSALTLDFPMTRTSIFQVGASMDAVFVGDAETPRRTAWFAQDLRTGADRAPILYDVEDLDDQFYDVSVSASAQFSNGVQPYLSYFSRESHKYIDSSGVVAGVRFVY